MLRILNIRTAVPMKKPLEALVAKKLRCSRSDISRLTIVRRSIDARRKPRIYFVFTVDAAFKDEGRVWKRCRDNKDVRQLAAVPEPEIIPGTVPLRHRPVVIGTGPSGLAAALALAEHGYAPIVFERGCDVDTRTKDVEAFWCGGPFKADSNVQFGEGGAGTFSDGKLTTRVNHPLLRRILQTFVDAGAPEEILYAYNPHVGTDVLRRVVKNMRQTVEARGGEVHFLSCVTAVNRDGDGKIVSVTVNGKEEYPTELVVMGIGHSARDTYYMLHDKGITLEKKPFAVGVRIEHSQEVIDRAQYGCPAEDLGLEPADYALVYHSPQGRSCYSFCMCPGGVVVGAASEEGRVVTNGMSLYKRDSGIANSAVVVNVTADDMGGTSPLAGIEFQRRYEELAYKASGSNYYAPVQTVGSFLKRPGAPQEGPVHSYRPGVTWTDLHGVLPDFVTATLTEALPYFGRRIHGFDADDVVMTGVETRTSAPVRIVRGDDRVALGAGGLYPVGEGAGYAGGIMSAFLDGLETAIQIIRKYQPLEVK
ncbi:NAD(P)/FAD-dependent oxidoreductase [Megasphaera sp.]|uniref:NAD(P)/FAD-dependent oxidoreductase n=1 Tax=Megasphaera sp. TaxID=2023260 RepID=UPI0035213C91